MVEEIAAMRYCLRNAFRLAIETEGTEEHIGYVEIYSSGCGRLAKLLRGERGEGERLEAFLREAIDRAIEEVNEEWGMRSG